MCSNMFCDRMQQHHCDMTALCSNTSHVQQRRCETTATWSNSHLQERHRAVTPCNHSCMIAHDCTTAQEILMGLSIEHIDTSQCIFDSPQELGTAVVPATQNSKVVEHSTAQHSTAQHQHSTSTAQHSAAQRSTALRCVNSHKLCMQHKDEDSMPCCDSR